MSSHIANLCFEHPEPSRIDRVEPKDVLFRVRCVCREITMMRTRQDWDEEGVKIGHEYDVVDVNEWQRHTLGEDKPTPMFRIGVKDNAGTWWLPAACFEEIKENKRARRTDQHSA